LDADALKTIELSIEDFAAYEGARLRLQAFTDDVGTANANEKLAQQRAEAVRTQLLQMGIAAASLEIIPSEQLIPDKTGDLNEQRRKSRRVNIEVLAEISAQSNTLVDKQLLKNFFAQERLNDRQYFDFDAIKGTVIRCKEGTLLQIPSRVFANADGTIYEGAVSFAMQELYSYADLMLQNVPTTSAGQLIETAGSFYMEATDSLGNNLSLASGKAIQVSLPTALASNGAMQLFNGQEDTTGRVDWTAAAQPVRLGSNLSLAFNGQDGRELNAERLGELLEILDSAPKLKELPKEKFKPRLKPKAPKLPKYKQFEPSSREELAARYPQMSNESQKAYWARLLKKRKSEYKKGYVIRTENNKLRRAYRSDSLAYDKAQKIYSKDSSDYVAYCKLMQERIIELSGALDKYNPQLFLASHHKLARVLARVGEKSDHFGEKYEFLKKQIERYQQEGYDVQALLAFAETVTMPDFSKKEKKRLDQLSNSFRNYYNGIGIWENYKSITRKYGHSLPMSSFFSRVKFTYNKCNGESLPKSYCMSRTRGHYERMKETNNFVKLGFYAKEAKELYEKNKSLIDKHLNAIEMVENLQDAIAARRNELGLLSTQELAQAYGNAMNITSMGWINCDRFLNLRNENKEDVEIITEYSPNKAVFVLFEDIRGVMSAAYDEDKKAYVVKNIPAGQSVKVIGMDVSVNDANIFMEMGKVATLRKIKPIFERKTLEEAKAMVAAL
jgi:hypothetical protein